MVVSLPGRALLQTITVFGLLLQEAQGHTDVETLELNVSGEEHRIVGGDFAKPGEFPYVVSIKNAHTNRHFCGGALLTVKHVLTACHCIVKLGTDPHEMKYKLPSSMVVHAGALDIRKGGGQKNVGRKCVAYPSCSKSIHGWKYDVGVLITRRFTLEKSVIQTIPLPVYPSRSVIRDTINFGGGIECYATGWGRIRHKGGYPDQLLKVKVELEPQESCEQKIDNRTAWRFDNQSELCAYGGEGYDACQGDSGSPLTCNVGGVAMVMGVVSWGIGCGGSIPGVYGRIDGIKPWLKEVLLQDEAPLSAISFSVVSLISFMCFVNQFV